ncbi:MAG: NUDIX domain-containing protein [Candidatus Nanosalina sp.]
MDHTTVLIRREDKFFFVKNDENEWAPITAEIEHGETLRESLRKNIRKETGSEIEIEDKIERVEGDEERNHWYLAEEVSASEENPDPDQISSEEGKWLNPEESDNIEERTQEFIREHRQELLE